MQHFKFDRNNLDASQFFLPVLIPMEKDGPLSTDAHHALYVTARHIRYAFSCEDFTDKFTETTKFIKAYYKHNILKSNSWFKSHEEKQLATNPELFSKNFYNAIENDLREYTAASSEPLVETCFKELGKLRKSIMGAE